MKYWVSFVEEFWPKQRPTIMCRIEVYERPEKSQYSTEEIHFCTDDEKAYNDFREKYDWKTLTKKKLDKVRGQAKSFKQEWLDRNKQ